MYDFTTELNRRLHMALRNLMTEIGCGGVKVENETNETKRNERNETERYEGSEEALPN